MARPACMTSSVRGSIRAAAAPRSNADPAADLIGDARELQPGQVCGPRRDLPSSRFLPFACNSPSYHRSSHNQSICREELQRSSTGRTSPALFSYFSSSVAVQPFAVYQTDEACMIRPLFEVRELS
jgi:hypothetical protein